MPHDSVELVTVTPTSLVVPTLRGAVVTRIKEELETLAHRRRAVSDARAIEEFIHVLTTEILPEGGR